MNHGQRTSAVNTISQILRQIVPGHLAYTLAQRAMNDWKEIDTIRFGTLGKEQFNEFVEQQKK